MRPKPVRIPVRTTTPRPDPSRTIVPIERARAITLGNRVGGLLDRERLAGEHGLVALELDGLEQANVGRDDVADRQLQEVARHQRR